jgi:glycosyltransferase involved in cell wall biosynthesis
MTNDHDQRPMTNDERPPTIAWFSPLPPVRSGIAAYSAELLPLLAGACAIHAYPEPAAHDFVWRHRRQPYDLVVYQLGNAPCHDYMWAYLAAYPGLVVLHDARLHHARARHLLHQARFDDYRREFAYDHPDARPDVAEYAVEGLGGPISYLWPMIRVVLRTARMVAVHNPRVADELRDEYPDVPIDTIRMGVPHVDGSAARMVLRRQLWIPESGIVFGVFGKVTAEKRVGPILQALAALVDSGRDVYLLIVGDEDGYPALDADVARHGLVGRVRVAGHVEGDQVGASLAAADACLCLRWPTAQETSASWLRCLAAARPTVISDLAHLVDVPASVALRVDLLDEERQLETAMRQLADDSRLRDDLARAGHAYWATHHTMDVMARDYQRVLTAAASHAAPRPSDLPQHFLDDYSDRATSIVRTFGYSLDILEV